MEGLNIPLVLPDLWQQEAVRALKAGHDVVVDAPTGAGKTWIFELFFEQANFNGGRQAVYTVPTRALANDKWLEWKRKGWEVGVATGDLAENLDAPVIVATLETQRERFLRGEGPSLLVVDEYQMIADDNRGLNYELALALAPPDTQLLLLSGSVENPQQIVDWLQRLDRACDLVRVGERPVPLDEIPVETLPPAPRHVKGYWPRIAASALMGDLGPLLIFIPKRNGAEKLARQIAAALPEDDPIPLSPDQERLLGRELAGMLKSRVAWHHSGLGYAARAGIIEPLAKHGQLRVIVATMGLAAGINFSVRTVLVSETSYMDGPFQRDVRPDELLQMFGRAGRRGLDEVGYALTTRDSPGLMDTAPRRLQRVHQVDWPTLLRVMEEASANGTSPFEAARNACDRLFSKQNIQLGFDNRREQAAAETETADDTFLQSGPHRTEFLNAAGDWEILSDAGIESRPLADCLVYEKEKWIPALRSRAYVDALDRGKVCKLSRGNGEFVFGKDRRIGSTTREGHFVPLAWVRNELALEGNRPIARDKFNIEVLVPLRRHLQTGSVPEISRHGHVVSLRVDYSAHRIEARIDAGGNALIDPATRRVAVDAETVYAHDSGARLEPPPGSAAFAWRKLNLVDESGVMTRRGRIFSRFQKGEGLMISAALEDESYPVDEIAWHIANLRAGQRFSEVAEDRGSSRLTAAARAAYGTLSYEGYLDLGLCPGYGEGAAELVEAVMVDGRAAHRDLPPGVNRGDVERASVEWLSILRHITHATDSEWDRWRELVRAAADLLKEHARPLPELPELPVTVLDHKVRLRPRI